MKVIRVYIKANCSKSLQCALTNYFFD